MHNKDKNELFFNRYYPYESRSKSNFAHTAVLGIGGNIGDVKKRFKKLFFYLKQRKSIKIIKTSPILKNPPFGFLDQDDFYNAIIVIKTPLSAHMLLKYILFVEKRFKRIRNFKDSPRTLDIDMIFYDNISINTRYLTLPHPHFHKRDSVMIPLSYI